ncbi:MAG: hypothetical protein ABR910_17435 [Acidobacteriaceae bacterium]|jgi:hypothetical protein
MTLFEAQKNQIGVRPKRYSEPTYPYYRDSERVGVSAIRDLLEIWFAEIPETEKLDLKKRFRSPIELHHRAALFELYLHRLLVSSGHTAEFHPVVENKATRPDFLATLGGRPRFYVEAVTVGDSQLTEVEENRVNLVYDTLNVIESPDFFLSVSVDGAPSSSPSGAQLRKDLGRWLSSLDWSVVNAYYSSGDFASVPTYIWEHKGWKVEFEPIPKGPKTRGTKSVRAIALTAPQKARRVSHDLMVREAVISKNRYGKLTLPLLVAVQVVGDFPVDLYDVLNGLLGQESFVVRRDGSSWTERIANGAWVSRSGPQNTTVSAAAVWSTLVPWSFASVEPIMVHNPFAEIALSETTLPITQHKVCDGKLQELKGCSISTALCLPASWPPPVD